MQSSDIPSGIELPFADAGAKQTIPVASQIGVTPGRASYTDGFPPLTRTPVAGGGVPPFGTDMNGILNAVTDIQQWQTGGGAFKFNSAWATANGGYPKGAVLSNTANDGYWLSLIENNTTDPDAAANVNWSPIDTYGITTVNGLTNVNVTLTPAQYSKRQITLNGTLTGNVQIIFPTIIGEWGLINNTTGAFTVTAKYATGMSVTIPQSGQPVKIYGDGTNVKYSNLPASLIGHGQCRFIFVSATQCRLDPRDGMGLIIADTVQQVPSAGVTLGNGGLSASTLYYVYAFMNAGVMTLEASTTNHSTSSNGVEVKTGDTSRTLVGMLRTNASSQFVNSTASRLVATYFNQNMLNAQVGVSGATNFTNTSSSEISASYRIEFLNWAGNSPIATYSGRFSNSSNAETTFVQSSLDASPNAQENSITGALNGSPVPFITGTGTSPSEGYHLLTLFGRVTGNTGSVSFVQGSVITRG